MIENIFVTSASNKSKEEHAPQKLLGIRRADFMSPLNWPDYLSFFISHLYVRISWSDAG